MFRTIKEYFRDPQIGDIWYIEPHNPFDRKYRYIIIDKKDKWIQLTIANPINDLSIKVCTAEYTIKHLKSYYKRETKNA